MEKAETPLKGVGYLNKRNMPLSQAQRNQIASYKIQIEGYRKDLQRYKDDKKRNRNIMPI